MTNAPESIRGIAVCVLGRYLLHWLTPTGRLLVWLPTVTIPSLKLTLLQPGGEIHGVNHVGVPDLEGNPISGHLRALLLQVLYSVRSERMHGAYLEEKHTKSRRLLVSIRSVQAPSILRLFLGVRIDQRPTQPCAPKHNAFL
jgi:hypothetical protein